MLLLDKRPASGLAEGRVRGRRRCWAVDAAASGRFDLRAGTDSNVAPPLAPEGKVCRD